MAKKVQTFRTISEVAKEIGVATHVLRFWETKFAQIKPMKRSGGRRYYREEDVNLISKIRYYLHEKRYTIEGVQRLIKTKGLNSIDNGKTVDITIAPDASSYSFLDKPVNLNKEKKGILKDLHSQLIQLKLKLEDTLDEV